MSQQIPEVNGIPFKTEDNYKKRLFLVTAFGYTEIANSKGYILDEFEERHEIARIVEEYTPPTPNMKTAELKISNAPSKLHSDGKSVYKISLRLLFPKKENFIDFMFFCGNEYKYYDERGGIYQCVLTDAPDISNVEAGQRYDVKITLLGVRKETEDKFEELIFQDLHQSGYEIEVKDSIVLYYHPISIKFPAINKEVTFYFDQYTLPLKQRYALLIYYFLLKNGLDEYFAIYLDDYKIRLAPKRGSYAGDIIFNPGSSNLIVDIKNVETAHWAKEHISNCAKLGFFTQYDKNGNYVFTFRPNEYASRAEMATVVNRARKYIERVIRG